MKKKTKKTTMAIGFLRPVGASSDVKELEYVSAIHQTDLKGVRADGSIRGEKHAILFKVPIFFF